MALAAHAARGAGAPAAQATQFGAAAVQHLARGRGVAALDAALAALPEGPILQLPLALLRVAEAAQGTCASARLDGAQEPLAHSYVEALPWQAVLGADGILEIDLAKPALRCDLPRLDLAPEVVAAWGKLAARLLVPESEASRRTGAGAGLSDND